MAKFLTLLENIISGFLPFSLLIFIGLYLSFKSRFLQFSGLLKSFSLIKKAVMQKKTDSNSFSSFQAATTALSAAVGTGNIVGVSSALILGGPGAIFWMWLSSFMGMLIKYAEITLGIKYRKNEKGGPMYYIQKAMPKKFKPIGYLFSILLLPTVIISGNITQTAVAVEAFGLKGLYSLIIVVFFAALCYLSLKKGITGIGRITEKLVPFMSAGYIIICLIVILANRNKIPNALTSVLIGAFSPKSVTGGVVASTATAMFTGASRGVFSNEAGLGTSAIAHSRAFDADLKTQGLFGIFEVFIDTTLLCTLTALTILVSGVKIEYGSNSAFCLVSSAFATVFKGSSNVILCFMLCCFSLSSVIGWAVYGKAALEHLKADRLNKIFDTFYPLCSIVAIFLNSSSALRLSSILNGALLICNLPAILYLSEEFIYKKEKKYDTKQNKSFKNTT